jgi:hypothetical protein
MTVPLWVLRQTILPYGARLRKKPPKWEESKMKTFPLYQRSRTSWRDSGETFCKSSVNWNDARYWVGVRIGPTTDCGWSKCRRCDFTAKTEVQRRTHKGCHKPLELAYAALLKDKRCVICDVTTNHTSWGLPICIDIACVEKWKFDMTMNKNVRAALRVTGNPSPTDFTTTL